MSLHEAMHPAPKNDHLKIIVFDRPLQTAFVSQSQSQSQSHTPSEHHQKYSNTNAIVLPDPHNGNDIAQSKTVAATAAAIAANTTAAASLTPNGIDDFTSSVDEILIRQDDCQMASKEFNIYAVVEGKDAMMRTLSGSCDLDKNIHVGPYVLDTRAADEICQNCGVAWHIPTTAFNSASQMRLERERMYRVAECVMNSGGGDGNGNRGDGGNGNDGMVNRNNTSRLDPLAQHQMPNRQRARQTYTQSPSPSREHSPNNNRSLKRKKISKGGGSDNIGSYGKSASGGAHVHESESADERHGNESGSGSGYSGNSGKRSASGRGRGRGVGRRNHRQNQPMKQHVSHTSKVTRKGQGSSIYNPMGYFRECILRYEGRDRPIPQRVIDMIEQESNRTSMKIDYYTSDEIMRTLLGRIGLNSLYPSIPQIKQRISGCVLPKLKEEDIELLEFQMRALIQHWSEVRGTARTSLVRYQVILDHLCVLNGCIEYERPVTLMKNRKKLHRIRQQILGPAIENGIIPTREDFIAAKNERAQLIQRQVQRSHASLASPT